MTVPVEYDLNKADIIKAADEVFLKYGFSRVSMLDISKASGKGRSTLYYYFKNKTEVFEAFAACKFTHMLNESQQLISSGACFSDNIERYYKTKFQHFKQLLIQYSNLFEDMKVEPALILKKRKLFFKDEAEIMQKIIYWAIDKQEITPLLPDDVNFLAETMVTAFRSFEQEMLMYGGMENFESKISWLSRVLGKGLQ